VLSTLHTNDAPSAITRLVDIGVQPFLIGATLLGVVAQRLVRTLCPHCKQSAPLDVKAWQGLVGANAIPHPKIGYRAVGCEECRQTGYLGRTGLYEMLTMRKELNTLLQEDNVNAGRLREAALQLGMRSLRVSGADKVSSGLTTIEEVLSVLPAG
jgi:general secretion pathway protein E